MLISGITLTNRQQNILVSWPSPQWIVKIGDFGISKRVEEGDTALRTLIGTEGYLAPEVRGLLHAHHTPRGEWKRLEYTAAVDIWSLGEIAFRMMTQQAAFPELRDLVDYVDDRRPFPIEALAFYGASREAIDFLTKAMSASPGSRLTAREAAAHRWVPDPKPESRPSSRGSEL